MTRASVLGRMAVGITLVGMGLGTGGAASAQEVTFARDIAPLLQTSCQTCHRPGSLAPMSLMTYEEARPWARSIKNRVVTRSMPPWHVDKTVGYQRFMNDTSLSDEQIDMVVRWVDAGAPLGDPDDLPSPVEWPVGDRFLLEDQIGAPDLVVTGPEWTMPAEGQDQWMDQRVDATLPETRWVRAIETKPTIGPGRRITHHASSYVFQRKSAAVVEAEQAMRRGEVGVEAVIEVIQRPTDEDAEEVREF
ncbi:MAG: cytochrome c, partial [bacterium]